MRYVLAIRSKEFQEIKWKWGLTELVVKIKKKTQESVIQLLTSFWIISEIRAFFIVLFKKKLIILEPRLHTQFSDIEQYKVLHNSVTIYEKPLGSK